MIIAVCDDNRIHLEHTLQKLRTLPACNGASFRSYDNPGSLLAALETQGAPVDILVLDIQMEVMDGIELARRVNRISPACQIIFLTAYAQYAQDVYEANHVYMVLKQDFGQRIAGAMQKAMEKHAALHRATVQIKTAGRIQSRLCIDVWYLEREGRRVCVHLADESIWTYQRPQELLEPAEASSFLQCHKSFFVNIRAIASWEKNRFLLRDGREVPISRPYQAAAKEWFFRGIQTRV